MNVFKKIKEWFINIFNMYRQIMLDNKNHEIFIKTIKSECYDRKSNFVKLGIKLNSDGESLVYVIKIPLEVQSLGQDFMIMDKLNEGSYFITDFLKNQAGFMGYVTLPEYFHIEDPTTDSVSTTYIAVWKFNPMISLSLKKKLYAYPSVILTVITICAVLCFLL